MNYPLVWIFLGILFEDREGLGLLAVNLQLARMSVEDKRGRQALGYLSHIRDNDSSNPVVLELRARALSLSGQCAEASEMVKRLEGQPAGRR